MWYYSLNQYLKERFGEKTYKLSLNAGFTCPNRDGTLGTQGCAFCSAGGSGEFAEDCLLPISGQIEKAKLRVNKKIKTDSFIAYFQAYTNTYAPVEVLREKFTEAIENKSIKALSIATRPDCLGEDVIELISELNRKKPVWIELGLQTIHSETARYIGRGYPLSVYDDAAKNLKEAGIEFITHMIIGLKSETEEQIVKTAEYIAESGAKGIKLQLLHILKNTRLEKEYLNGEIDVLTMEEYIDILCKCIEKLPPDIVIHRLTGDGDKKILLAPMWSADKKKVINAIRKEFEKRDIIQGSKFKAI